MVRLTMEEAKKLEVLNRVMDGQVSVSEASQVLGRSLRQIYRLLKKLRAKGVRGVLHGNRGNQYARKLSKAREAQIIKLVSQSYRDVNDSHLVELLSKREGIEVSRSSLRLLLRAAQLGPKQRRRVKKYRCRRERKAAAGMMVQIDGSVHNWLESRSQDRMTLVGGIDDATNKVWAKFEAAETTWSYLELVRNISLDAGIPLSLYADRHTIFQSPKQPTVLEQLQGLQALSQFGRAMQELGVELIPAYSAAAKGRIERLWRTFQDRLIVEMRLAGIASRDEANEFLKEFLKGYNSQFGVPPKDKIPVFRKRPRVQELDRILCLKEERVVGKDHTVRFEGLILQIPPSSKWASIAQQRVQVLQLRDASIEIVYKNRCVARFSAEAVNRLMNNNPRSHSQIKAAA